MRRLFLLSVGLAVLTCGYAIWPLASAFQIKQAIKAGDVATLERKVHWAPVRASLKASLATLSPRIPIASDDTRLAGAQSKPSIWARVKAAAAPMVADRLIDMYVTAEGVTKLQQIKRGGFLSVFGVAVPDAPGKSATAETTQAGDDAAEGTNLASRFYNFYNRILHARFHSLSVAEFEIADKNNPARRIISKFELSDFEWKLSSVKIVGEGF